MTDFSFHEFFAGGGMARAGLGPGWRCRFANDIDLAKARAYAENWGAEHFVRADVADIVARDLPGLADLIWASFPCQDLSLAGDGRGLGAQDAAEVTRSGSFWPFWRLVGDLAAEGRAPPLVVLENVLGVLTSGGGADFAAIAAALDGAGYRFGVLVVDARRFVPQSRPRVFVIALHQSVDPPSHLVEGRPSPAWATQGLLNLHARLAPALRRRWIWWRLPEPEAEPSRLADLIDDRSEGVRWHDPHQTARLLDSMSPANRRKVDEAKAAGERRVGTLYRRTRTLPGGGRAVQAEVRFDEVAGCLRTPAGGSSRQKLLVVEGQTVRSRLLSAREAARLMGLPDSYRLPSRYNEAYHLAGDGVVAPVVRHLAEHLLEPLARAARDGRQGAAA